MALASQSKGAHVVVVVVGVVVVGVVGLLLLASHFSVMIFVRFVNFKSIS